MGEREETVHKVGKVAVVLAGDDQDDDEEAEDERGEEKGRAPEGSPLFLFWGFRFAFFSCGVGVVRRFVGSSSRSIGCFEVVFGVSPARRGRWRSLPSGDSLAEVPEIASCEEGVEERRGEDTEGEEMGCRRFAHAVEDSTLEGAEYRDA